MHSSDHGSDGRCLAVFLDTQLLDTLGPDGKFLISNANNQPTSRQSIPYAPNGLGRKLNYTSAQRQCRSFIGAQACIARRQPPHRIEPVEGFGYKTLGVRLVSIGTMTGIGSWSGVKTLPTRSS